MFDRIAGSQFCTDANALNKSDNEKFFLIDKPIRSSRHFALQANERIFLNLNSRKVVAGFGTNMNRFSPITIMLNVFAEWHI